MRILFIEDEKKITDALKELCRIQNIDCDVANDGEEGLLFALNPIYDVIVSIDRVDLKDVGQGDDQCTCVYCVPPGVYLLKTIREEEDYYDMCKHFGPSITFRDARGKYWTRNAQGKLKKQCRDCFVTRDISFPPAFTSIEILQMK